MSTKPVELLSIYPTLIDLCGLTENADIEGVSLRPLVDNLNAPWEHVAITTLGQNNHAVRDERWRYIHYADGSEELYDHQTDPNEWNNLASNEPAPSHAKVIARLKKHLPATNVPQLEETKELGQTPQDIPKNRAPHRSRKTSWNSREDWNTDKPTVDWLFPFIDKNNDGKIDADEYQTLQDYKKKHADWQNRARKELGI